MAADTRRSGFTLIEMITVLAVLAVLAAMLLPAMLQRLTGGRAAALAATLDGAADAIIAFRTDVRRYPAQLVDLTSAPTVSSTDACGRPLPANLRARWRGPYLRQSVSLAGINVADAVVQNSLARIGVGADTLLEITALLVDQQVAAEVDRAADNGNLGTGTVLWTAGVSGQGTLLYRLAIRGC